MEGKSTWHAPVVRALADRLLTGLFGAAVALLVDVQLLDARVGQAVQAALSGS